ncbi:MAG TPA: nitrogen fixation protein NifQ [Bradyrhizobium sp.]|nr:nitrogen fixation protein NifQ [Bradyrhizobium sp.]
MPIIARDSAPGRLAPASPAPREHLGIATYRLLAGCNPADADITDNNGFDRHVLASIMAAAAMDGGAIAICAGLNSQNLSALIAEYFPNALIYLSSWCKGPDAAEDDEVGMVRDLLLAQRSTTGDIGRWLAAMVARRAIEPNHLWEDLGLRDRSELSRLLMRHFAPLASRNTRNMRWKRFFYRMLCEDDGFVMCTTPVCTQCNDFALCFGEESGESRMAERRRDFLLQATAPAAPSSPFA